MLAIRMQRTGRKGHAMFRVIVQDSRRTPTSGKVVFRLGSYDPHTKAVIVDKEKAAFYLEHGAQPSDRVARLLKSEGVKLPAWVELSADKKRVVRNADKRRSTRPPEAAKPEAPAEETPVAEAPAEPTEAASAEAPAEAAEEKSAEPVEETATPETAEKVDETPAVETTEEAAAPEPAEEPTEEPTEAA